MRSFLILFYLLILGGCAGQRSLLTRTPDASRPSFNDTEITDTVDTPTVSVVIQDTVIPKTDTVATPKSDTSVDFSKLIDSIELEPHTVRIALESKKQSFTVFSYGRVAITCNDKKITIAPGAIQFAVEGEMIRISAHNKSAIVQAPCELSTVQGQALFSYKKNDYRGAMRVISPKSRELMLINVLPVETYLRGVVPLEIGRKGKNDSAAVQAQAIAARTYTYKRMSERSDWDYDLLPTVADQVYGGASAEHDGADQAIQATAGMVMVFNNDLVDALYHSTCGGHTASKDEVWGGVPFPYLIGRPDIMSNGAPFCGISPLIRWEESWSISDFSRLVSKYSSTTPGQPRFNGRVNTIHVTSKTKSGRVNSCRISGPSGSAIYGGDKIRFVFRRPVAGNGILRSSSFTVEQKGDTIIAHGRGYGHGIGMCQMGAIGRARYGYSCSEILHAYYSGIVIEEIDEYYRQQQQLARR